MQPVQSGLSDTNGVIELFVPTTLGNHNSSMIPNEGGSPVKVSIQKLEDYLTTNQVDQIDLIKIDVEGFEPNVLRGTEKLLQARKVKAILCEFNKYWLEANGSSPELLRAYIQSFGYGLKYGAFKPNCELQNLFFCLD